MEQRTQRAIVASDGARPSVEQPRARKHMLALEWRIPEAGGDPIWKEATDLRAALDRLLDTTEKRATASRLVLAWEALHVPGQLDADLESLHDLDRSLEQLCATEIEPGANAATSELDVPKQRSCLGSQWQKPLWIGAI